MWIAFLTRHDLLNKDNLPKELNDVSLKKALNVLDVMNFTKEEREAYEEHLKWFRMEVSTLRKYEQKYRDEGIQIGEARGKFAIAKKMLAKNKTIDEIIELTDLTREVIEKLKNDGQEE